MEVDKPVQTSPTKQKECANVAIQKHEWPNTMPIFQLHAEEMTSTCVTTRRCRSTRNAISDSNNNINKIAANFTAKAGAAEAEAAQAVINAYGRKRKNPQVTSTEELTPAKVPNLEQNSAMSETGGAMHTKLVISKKKGRIFKSRALAQPDLATDQQAAAKRYLYKHSWDAAEANGGGVENVAGAATVNSALHAFGVELDGHYTVIRNVKAAQPKKKGRIFKSRALVQHDLAADQQAAAKRYLYKHSWDAAEANGGGVENVAGAAKDETASTTTTSTAAAAKKSNDTTQNQKKNVTKNLLKLGKLTGVIKPNPQTAATVNSALHAFGVELDGHYTVIRNVKAAQQMRKIGDYQDMDDDVEYILDALQPHNPISTRCLSALQLATKCMMPAFRKHVRKHSVVPNFFKALSDANNDLSLGLCTSAIMFILSQEGLNMDLDRDSMKLMMNLLKSESVAASSDRANYERNNQKVRELCEQMKAQGRATHLNVESITVGTLAMETLLSLKLEHAGEWFKDDLRNLDGLEHIIKTTLDYCRQVIEEHNNKAEVVPVNWTRALLDNMQTVKRYMHVIEHVTQMNEENQKYMLTYGRGSVVNTLCALYRLCDREMMLHPTTEHTNREDPGVVMRELLVPVMKVLINLTHTYNPQRVLGAELLGQHSEVINISFHILLQAPHYIPDRCIFELSILVLLLLINLSMYTVKNRAAIMKTLVSSDGTITAAQAIMEYFYECEKLARVFENKIDVLLDNQENKMEQMANHHMECTLKGSYACILIGHLITDNEENEAQVRPFLHGNGFKEIINVLEKYYKFLDFIDSSEVSGDAHNHYIKHLIDYFKSRD